MFLRASDGPEGRTGVVVKAGQHLCVTDLEGKQVVDMAVCNEANVREKLSTSYSRARQEPKTPGPYQMLVVEKGVFKLVTR